MADTYIAYAPGVTLSAGKNMLAISNHTGSGKTLKIYRIWLINTSVANVAGGTCLVQIQRNASVASFTGGSAITPVKLKTASPNLHANILINAGTTTTLTSTGVFRQLLWCSEEVQVASLHLEDLLSIPAFGLVWDSGYGNSTVEPITLREGFGLTIATPAAGGGTYAGNVDLSVEFTYS
jgi:hypothetical protein